MKPLCDPPDLFTIKTRDAAQRWLQRVARLVKVSGQVQTALATHFASLSERPDLAALARYIETDRVVSEMGHLDSAGEWRDPVVDAAAGLVHEARDAWLQRVTALTPYEWTFVAPTTEEDRLLDRGMQLHRHHIYFDGLGQINAMPDRVAGNWNTTDWLDNYVYLEGGRILRRSAGPIAHWIVVL